MSEKRAKEERKQASQDRQVLAVIQATIYREGNKVACHATGFSENIITAMAQAQLISKTILAYFVKQQPAQPTIQIADPET